MSFRPILLIVGFAVLASPALADDSAMAGVIACKALTDPLERVACYDAAVAKFEAAQSAGEVTVVTRADVEKVRRESFGFQIPSLPSFGPRAAGQPEAKLDRVTEPVKSVSESAGKLRVVLANGQVWVQTDDKSPRVRSPGSAEIFEAALGSYKMKLDGGLAFRVKRER